MAVSLPRRAARTARDAIVVRVFRTQLGWIAVAWRGDRVARLTFGHDTPAAALAALDRGAPLESAGIATSRPTPPQADLIARLKRLAQGRPVEFADVPIDLQGLTDFQRRVFARCRRIGAGQTMSYAELAAAVGAPGAARAVGNCMRINRVPLVVPCHRVVGSGGKLGGYSAAGGLATKTHLLALEGCDLPR